MPGLFSRRPEWLRYAFRMEEPEIPNKLRTSEIIAVVELAQGGHANNDHRPITIHETTAGTGLTELIAPNQDEGYLVTHIEIANGGAPSTARNIVMRIRKGSTGETAAQSVHTVGAGGALVTNDVLGSRMGLWVPPSFQLAAAYSVNIAAGNDVSFVMIVLPVPRGVKPW